jgi:hypothetical protein
MAALWRGRELWDVPHFLLQKPSSLILTVSRSSPPIPLGSVSYENHVNEQGERYVWLPPNVVDDRLKAQRRPGEGYRDVILRLTAGGAVVTMRGLIIAGLFVGVSGPALAETVYCSENFQGYRVCDDGHGTALRNGFGTA